VLPNIIKKKKKKKKEQTLPRRAQIATDAKLADATRIEAAFRAPELIAIFVNVGQIRSDWNVEKLARRVSDTSAGPRHYVPRSSRKGEEGGGGGGGRKMSVTPRRSTQGECLKGEGREREKERGRCIFKIVTMQFRWRIHNESLESGAPLLPG